MIARHWRGWTKIGDADAYEALLKSTVLQELKRIDGYRGGYVLRNDGPLEAEFVVMNFFDSLDAVKRFAGEDYAIAMFEPEAKKLLSRVEPMAMHYEVRVSTVLERFGDVFGAATFGSGQLMTRD
jgi:heme-degrading monooxygenase HmoA